MGAFVLRSSVVAAQAATAEQDWINRSTAAGVVWAHDFRSDAEVDQFRWAGGQGNDPNSVAAASKFVRRIRDDGPTGNCMEIMRPAGSTDSAAWRRPFAPINSAGNGIGINDRAANGTLTLRTWDSSNPSQNNSAYAYGWYGHSDYHSDGAWDGSVFYIQFRVKISNSRWLGANTGLDGKLAYIGVTGYTPAHELLIQSKASRTYGMYTGFGSPGPLEFLTDPQNFADPTVPSRQPGGPYAATCKYPNINASNCWAYEPDEWHTVLIKVTPGHGVNNEWGPTDNGIEVWVARSGDSSYTKIWDKRDYTLFFHPGSRIGWNEFQPSAYFNGQNASHSFTQRYAQIIFSKDFIPCPLPLQTPSWFSALANLEWVGVAGGGGYSANAWQNGSTLDNVRPTIDPPGASGHYAITDAWTCAAIYQRGGVYLLGAEGGHDDYYGNEGYALTLKSAVPSWSRIWEPTPNAQVVTSNIAYNQAYTGYADGAPRTAHGWYSKFIDRDGHFISTFINASPNGQWTTEVYSRDLNNLVAGWTFHGRLWQSVPGSAGSEFQIQTSPGGYDRYANEIWRVAEGAVGGPPSNGVAQLNVTTMLAAGAQSTGTSPQTPGSTLHNFSFGSLFNGGWGVVIDDMSPRCMVCMSPNTSTLRIINLESPGTTFTEITPVGSPTGYVTGAGAVYHRASRAILVAGPQEYGQAIRKLSISGSNPLSATYTWSAVAGITGATATMGGNHRGTWGKLQLVEDMGNGQSLLVVATSTTAKTLVMKLPKGGI